MKKEEVEKKLKISEKTCIHCPTLELAKQVLSIFHQLGLKWSSGNDYTSNPNWDKHKENTAYQPFDGEFSSLEFACEIGYKTLNAKEFILLHTEGEEFDLQSYTPKGDLIGFPKEIISRMLDCQEEQGNPRDVSIFENRVTSEHYNKGFTWDETKEGRNFWYDVINNKNVNLFFEKYPKQDNLEINNKMTTEELENYTPKGDLIGFPKEIISRMLECQEEQGNKRNVTVFEKWKRAAWSNKGFDWDKTKEGWDFWHDVLNNKNFIHFFELYPKQDNPQDNPQEFKVGEEVFDIILGQKGKILQISTDDSSISPICASFNGGKKTYALDGRHHMDDKYPRLLHYRDDYDYNVIDFNNLPKRQPPKRWRAEKGGEYYTVRFALEGWIYTYATKDNNDSTDNINYNSGNYFRTEVEAEIIAQKLNNYFKQLIQEEHEHEGN